MNERPLDVDDVQDDADPAASSTDRERYQRLKTLIELHESGQLSDLEFRLQKRDILRGHPPEKDPIEVIIAAYKYESDADAALVQLHKLERGGHVYVIDAAAMVRQHAGKVIVKALSDMPTSSGTIVSSLADLIFPPSALAPAIADRSLDTTAARWNERGIEHDDLRAIGERLQPGSSAIVAIVYNRQRDRITEMLAGFATISRHALSPDVARTISTERDPRRSPDDE